MIKSGQPSAISRLVRYIANPVSGIIVVFIAFMINMPFIWLAKLICDIAQEWLLNIQVIPSLYWFVYSMIAVNIALILSLYPLSAVWIRAFLRAQPVRLDDTAHQSLGLLVGALIISCFGMYVSVRDLFGMMISLLFPALLFRVHRKHQLGRLYRHSTGFILFLRAFNSPSDEAIARAILRTSPENMPLVIVIDPCSNDRHTDPIGVCLAGLNPFKVNNPIPIYAKIDNYRWNIHVRYLIEGASCIIIDASIPSAGVSAEIEIILNSEMQHKAIFLLSKGSILENSAAGPIASNITSPILVRYEMSWRESIFRIVFGIVLVTMSTLDLLIPWSGQLLQLKFYTIYIQHLIHSWSGLIMLPYVYIKIMLCIFRRDLTRRSCGSLRLAIIEVLQKTSSLSPGC